MLKVASVSVSELVAASKVIVGPVGEGVTSDTEKEEVLYPCPAPFSKNSKPTIKVLAPETLRLLML